MRTTTWLDEPQRKKNKENSRNVGVNVHDYVGANHYANVYFSSQWRNVQDLFRNANQTNHLQKNTRLFLLRFFSFSIN